MGWSWGSGLLQSITRVPADRLCEIVSTVFGHDRFIPTRGCYVWQLHKNIMTAFQQFIATMVYFQSLTLYKYIGHGHSVRTAFILASWINSMKSKVPPMFHPTKTFSGVVVWPPPFNTSNSKCLMAVIISNSMCTTLGDNKESARSGSKCLTVWPPFFLLWTVAVSIKLFEKIPQKTDFWKHWKTLTKSGTTDSWNMSPFYSSSTKLTF